MIFQMPKRKLTLPMSSRSKKFRGGWNWKEFGQGFFGTLGDPLGTVISLARGQKPTWYNRGSRMPIKIFDHRRGFIGGILSSLGTGYLKDALGGAITAATRKSRFDPYHPALIAHKLTYRHPNLIPKRTLHGVKSIAFLPTDVRRSNVLTDAVWSLLQNPELRSFAKKAAISTAGIAIPKAINYIINNVSKKKKRQAEEEMDET